MKRNLIKLILLFFVSMLTVSAWGTPDEDYLCFTAETSSTSVMLYKQGSPTPVTIEYSTDEGANWTTVDFSSAITTGNITLADVGDKVYFRNAYEAKDVAGFSNDKGNYYFYLPHNVSVSGSIMSLVDKKVERISIPGENCFKSLFGDCKTLTSAADLKLPATVLTPFCYDDMFYGCSSLKTAPALPATELAAYCYEDMFSGCKSLTAAPELPAMALADGCYGHMFNGCESLTAAPELPATELVENCYLSMFYGCTKLNYLNVGFTEWDDENNATSFWLKGAGTNATNPTFECPLGLDMTTRDDDHVPEGWTIKNPDYLCITAEEAGATVRLIKDGEPTPVTIQYSTNEGANWTTVDFSSVSTTGDITITNAGDKVYFRNASTSSTFSQSSSNYYHFTFSEKNVSVSGNVMSLIDNRVKGSTIPCDYCFNSLFRDCKKLTSVADLKLPATELTSQCYAQMFSGCTSLTAAPELPATELTSQCYAGMFYGCTKLNSVKVDFIKWGDTDSKATSFWLWNAGTEATVTPVFECPVVLDTITIKRTESYVPENWTIKMRDYLCITAEKAGATVQLVKDGSPADVSLQYSTDCGKWDNYTIGTEITLTNVDDKVYFRNANQAKDVAGFSNGLGYYSFAFSDSVSVSGNIMSLVDNNVESTTIPRDGCFCSLFRECTTLTSAAELKLPATELKSSCYQGMFYNCSSLKTAPALSAAKLAKMCYSEMFYGCTALETAPAILPATTLAEGCYAHMFEGCTSLTAAPELPATELAKGCYYYMFYNCNKLNSVKVGFTDWLEDATLDWLLYAGEEATNPTFECPLGLDMTTRDEHHVPEGWLIKKVAPVKDYLYFTAEEAGAKVQLAKFGSPTPVTIQYITDDGENWTTVDFSSASTTGNITLANAGDKVYFRNAGTPSTFSTKQTDYYYFSTEKKVSVSGNVMSLVDKNVECTTIPCDYCFNSLFTYCKTLTSAAELKLPATTLTDYCYAEMFWYCTALETAPELPATELADYCYYGMFAECTALKATPELPATTMTKCCYAEMFYDCITLTAAPELKAMTLEFDCYCEMFYGCTALEAAPVLPATKLAAQCYAGMFYGCEKLNYVNVGFAAWDENEYATEDWLSGAGTKATQTPVFEYSAVELDVKTRDDSHVPEGWTIKKPDVIIDDTKPYTFTQDIEDVIVTYKREFAEAGKYEALYLPFSVTMTEELLAKVTIADIYMVSTKGSVVGGAQDAGVNVVVVKILGVGESTKPHTPYFIRPKAGADLEFTQEHTTLYAATDAKPGHIACATTKDKYDFIGTYIGEKLTPQAGSLIYLMQDGSLKKQTTIVDLPCNRWKMVKTPTEWNDSYVAPVSLSKMLVVTLGEDDTTGIIGIDANADANLDDAVYNLQGQMLNTVNGYQGVVIRNGQKYLIEQ